MFRLVLLCSLPGIVLFCAVCRAEVVSSSPQGFHLRVETVVKAPAEQAYSQFVRVEEWWNAEHTWFGSAENLSLEPVAGGCFCEREGDKSVLHMTVSHVQPGKSIIMLGGLGPLQAMGLFGAASFVFEPVSETSSRIIHEYRVSGYHEAGLGSLASIVDAVQTLQVDGLAARLDTQK